MTTATETAVRPRTVNVAEGVIVRLVFANGASFLVSQDGLAVESAPVAAAPAPANKPEATVETPAPAAPIRRGRKASKPEAAAPSAPAPAPAPAAPAAEAPKADKPKGKGKPHNVKREWLLDDEWLGIAEYNCKDGWREVAIIGMPKRGQYMVATFVKINNGDNAGHLAVRDSDYRWKCDQDSPKLRSVVLNDAYQG